MFMSTLSSFKVMNKKREDIFPRNYPIKKCHVNLKRQTFVLSRSKKRNDDSTTFTINDQHINETTLLHFRFNMSVRVILQQQRPLDQSKFTFFQDLNSVT